MRNSGYLFSNLIVNFSFGSYEAWDKRMVVELARSASRCRWGSVWNFVLPLDERLDIKIYTAQHFIMFMVCARLSSSSKKHSTVEQSKSRIPWFIYNITYKSQIAIAYENKDKEA